VFLFIIRKPLLHLRPLASRRRRDRGPHVWAWGVQYALEKMRLPIIPGGGMDARARANIVQRYQPTILLLTPSYALHLARIMQSMGGNPRETSVRTLFVAGEPGLSVAATRERIQDLWGARMVEFYGCTEASPHVGGFCCPASQTPGEQVATHLMEDVQIGKSSMPRTRPLYPTASAALPSAPI
jgi:phenylacetate-CoA ligase